MTCTETPPTLQRIPPADSVRAAMSPCAYVTPESLRKGKPKESDVAHLVSEDDKFTVGSWRAEPYSRFIDPYPGDEYARACRDR